MEDEKKTPAVATDGDTASNDGKDAVADEEGEITDSDLAEDTQEAQPKEKDEAPKSKPERKQSREQDAIYAERRRNAKAEAEQRERDERIRKQAEFDVKSGMVTEDELKDLGLGKVEDEDQLYLVERLREAKSKGEEDPVAWAYRQLYVKTSKEKAEAAKEEQEAKETERKQAETIAKEQSDFKAKHGKTTGEVLRDEPDFKAFFDKYGKPGTFEDCYATFHTIKGDVEQKAKKMGIPPISGTGKGNSDVSQETDEQFLKRTQERYGKSF